MPGCLLQSHNSTENLSVVIWVRMHCFSSNTGQKWNHLEAHLPLCVHFGIVFANTLESEGTCVTVRDWEMWRRDPRGMKVGWKDEKKGQRSNTTHSHAFSLFSISHSLCLFLNSAFCSTLTPQTSQTIPALFTSMCNVYFLSLSFR